MLCKPCMASLGFTTHVTPYGMMASLLALHVIELGHMTHMYDLKLQHATN